MRGWLRRLAIAGAALLLLTACAVVAASLAMQHRHGEARSFAGPVDAAIVLGSGIEPDMVPSWPTRRRVAAGVALLEAGLAERLILSGGRVGRGDVTAAGLMREHALSLGAPPDAVLVEGESRTTFENLRFSLAIARDAGLDRLALVTDDYHLLRASWLACYFGACGVELLAVPAIGPAAWPRALFDTARESLAWWYNLGKITLWSALDAGGIPEERRARLIW